MKELVVISGKGGTGKTSLVASFAALAGDAVLADCDVDAADLHLILAPRPVETGPFSGGKQASIRTEDCSACGECVRVCAFHAVRETKTGAYQVDPIACEGCGVCAWFCPQKAIDFDEAINGDWLISETRHGPMAHARLGIAQGNSGKLVTLVRRKARELARQNDKPHVIVDGSPGIGCPVIASVTGANLVVVVTEPTVSGRHDFDRVAALVDHFRIPGMLCVNKWDLNPTLTEELEQMALDRGWSLAGRIRYDAAVTQAQIQGLAVVEYQANGCAADIESVYSAVMARLQAAVPPAERESSSTQV